MKLRRVEYSNIQRRPSLISITKWTVGLILSASFILNNLDVIGLKINNPMPWLSVSHWINQARSPINNKEIRLSKEQMVGKHVLVQLDNKVMKTEIDSKLGIALNSMFVSKKLPMKQVFFSTKDCPLMIEKVTSKFGLNEFSCEVRTITIEKVIYKYQDEYYQKDVRLDNIILKRLDKILENTKERESIAKVLWEGKNTIIKFDNVILEDEEKVNVVIKKHWDLYKENKKNNNSINIENCPNQVTGALSLHSSFDCRLITFDIKDAIIEHNDNKELINTSVSDIVLYNFKLKI